MLSALEPLLDCSPSAVAILDTKGRVGLVNHAWRAYAIANGHRDPKFCVGMNYFDVCRAASGTDAEDARAVVEGLESVAAGGPPFTYEYTCHHEGQQSWFVLHAKRIEFAARYWIVAVHQDASARRQAETRSEQSLRAAETRRQENDLLRAMIDTLPDLIFAKDRSGKFIEATNIP